MIIYNCIKKVINDKEQYVVGVKRAVEDEYIFLEEHEIKRIVSILRINKEADGNQTSNSSS
jgi:hypothetical protein